MILEASNTQQRGSRDLTLSSSANLNSATAYSFHSAIAPSIPRVLEEQSAKSTEQDNHEGSATRSSSSSDSDDSTTPPSTTPPQHQQHQMNTHSMQALAGTANQNQAGPPQRGIGAPTENWAQQLCFNDDIQMVQFYKSQNINDKREISLPQEIKDMIFGFLDFGTIKRIFIYKGKFMVSHQRVLSMIGNLGVKTALEKVGVSVANMDALDPYRVFCTLVGYGCQECGGTKVRKPNWVYCKRICPRCIRAHSISWKPVLKKLQQAGSKTMTVTQSEKLAKDCIMYLSLKGTLPFGHHEPWNRLYYEPSVDAFIKKHFRTIENSISAGSFDDWCAQNSRAPRLEVARSMHNWHNSWQDEERRQQRPVNEDKKDARMSSILAKVAEMQSPISKRLLNCCRSFGNQYGYKEPLTEKAWIILEKKIVAEAKAHQERQIVFRISTKTGLSKDVLAPALLESKTFHNESGCTDVLEDDDYYKMAPEIIKEVGEFFKRERIHTIKATALMDPNIDIHVLYQCPTFQQQRQMFVDLSNLPQLFLSNRALKQIMAMIRYEAPCFMTARERMQAIRDAIHTAASHIDDGVLLRCSAYTEQQNFYGDISPQKMEEIVKDVRSQAGIIIAGDYGYGRPEFWA